MSHQTVVITGAGGGVGKQAVVQFVQEGWNVIALTHSFEDAQALSNMDHVQAIATDLADTAALPIWIQAVLVPLVGDSLDALVHTAAIAPVGPIDEVDAAIWDAVFHTNVVAPAILTRALLPQLRAARGSVIFINSGAGERAIVNHAVYSASKHALRAYANTLRLEESANGLRVTTIYPGQIATPMLASINHTLHTNFEPERYIQPDSVAHTIVWVANASPDVQITNIDVRPRQEITASFNV